MKKITLLLSLFIVLTANGRQIATSDSHTDFQAKRENIADERYFKIFDTRMSPEQREAMEFIYAYMPLTDIADYSGEFFLSTVDAALRASREMPWGKMVPDREFRHFVLPARVNNEYLDNCRDVFYAELRDRIKDLTMSEAVLEVNHWCHEKVTYQPSDGRTSSPLQSVRSAIGRCGEESTFTVAALRSVGIPARQVYTPRWAHTDDNHAWVEAWADGKWHFLGACEPEAVLNLGWFNAPASRGIMMHTTVFGKYDGPEEVLDRTEISTGINVTSNYAPVDDITVTALDRKGKPAAGAKVYFSVYNYSEYYPIGIKTTDSKGRASLTAGRGDLLVTVSDGRNFGIRQVSVGKDRDVKIRMNLDSKSQKQYDFNLVPPPPSANMPEVTAEAAAINEQRKAQEDEIRSAYESTFLTAENAAILARSLSMDADRTARVLTQSRGNWPVLVRFLVQIPAEQREKALLLLENVAEKDRRDITSEVLYDHFNTPVTDSPLFAAYVLNPRVTNEFLTPYKGFFTDEFGADALAEFRKDPSSLVALVGEKVKTDDSPGTRNLRMSPKEAWLHKITDPTSRNILFVAIARTAGIPARIDPVTGKTQWNDGNGSWNDVNFGDMVTDAPSVPTGTVRFSFKPEGRMQNPVYYSHFSISKVDAGATRQMEYPEGATFNSTFSEPMTFDEGQYMLTSGQRMADGGVLARTVLFTVKAGKQTDVELVMRRDNTKVQVIGNFNSESIYHDLATGTDKSLLSTAGRGYYTLIMLKPGHEPSIHALNDLSASRQALDEAGRTIFLIFPDAESASRFDRSAYNLPECAVIGYDIDGSIASAMPEKDMPSVIIGDTFNRVVFISSGYTINLGEKLVDTLHKIAE